MEGIVYHTPGIRVIKLALENGDVVLYILVCLGWHNLRKRVIGCLIGYL